MKQEKGDLLLQEIIAMIMTDIGCFLFIMRSASNIACSSWKELR